MADSEPSGYIADCVREMESLGLDEYGFNLTRTYYEDEALWQSFRCDFDAAMEKGTQAEYADAMEPLDIVTRFHDDVDFAGLGPEGVSNAFQIFCLDEDSEDEEDEEDEDEAEGDGPWSHEMGPGVIRSMCLMADEASMRSFKSTPYVIAVDALLHTGADLGYPGYFKVAIDCLMPKFYAAIGHFDLEKVAAAVDEDGIWRGMK
ncbi:hypothetical protein LMH87_001169 [Akanthomyces muscarius]|uniref:Uncharacterized protein n=1 Tax=Akanthomyces muscarius TaxID=2231603 RepID=A0A9W8QGV4_AKAMU|nr:hypothetical protein LMH87_001169 [Akanthomyces muscarius]KAJ4155949.1 hypothetical protein LMH87_001169 [Akanthomyces muscarius]